MDEWNEVSDRIVLAAEKAILSSLLKTQMRDITHFSFAEFY